jgi:hypothetical protein
MNMPVRQPEYPREEFARRGRLMYEDRIRAQVEPAQNGRIAAIDIETGEFSVADNVIDACKPLIARNPAAQLWTVRIGHRAVHRIGGSRNSPAS